MKRFALLYLATFISFSAFAKKEKISFNLKFGLVKGGEAVITISDTVYNGIPAVRYHVIGRTTGLTDKLFGVNDVYETIIDAETRLPLKSIRNIKEQKYRWYNETYYYHDIDSINSQKSGWSAVPNNLVDIISVFFYFVHTNNMEKMEIGKRVNIPTFHADKISDVSISYLGRETIKTDLGHVDSYVLTPRVDKGKLLKRSDGLKLYVSRENKVPVLIDFDMRIGALRAVLQSYKIDGEEQVTK